MFCSKCGSRLLDGGGSYCHYCGEKLVRNPNIIPDVSVYPVPTEAQPVMPVPVTPDTPVIPSPVIPVTAASSVAGAVGIAPEQAAFFPENEPVAEPQGASVLPIAVNRPEQDAAEFDTAAEAPAEPAQEAEKKAEKSYFGLPALVFCLSVIGILSVACGILATLYFGGF